MSDSYTILCIIEGDTNVFSVKIASNDIVDSLKEAIKTKKFKTLADIEADTLKLYHVEIPMYDPQNIDITIDYVAKAREEMNKSQPPPELRNPARKLAHVFDGIPPPEGTLHIIVQRPSGRLSH
jgi:hypothetical protein